MGSGRTSGSTRPGSRDESARPLKRCQSSAPPSQALLAAADQVWFSGRTHTGAVLTGHYRGGRWRGTNLLWEILGTDGEIRIPAPSGHLQVQPLNLQGAGGSENTLSELPVPEQYVRVQGIDPVRQSQAFIVAHTYQQLLRDLKEGTSLVPTWEHAVHRHTSIQLSG
jgi:predicted dehydrogenase